MEMDMKMGHQLEQGMSITAAAAAAADPAAAAAAVTAV